MPALFLGLVQDLPGGEGGGGAEGEGAFTPNLYSASS